MLKQFGFCSLWVPLNHGYSVSSQLHDSISTGLCGRKGKSLGATLEKQVGYFGHGGVTLFGILEESGVTSGEMEGRERDFVIQHCVAIATRHGFDMGYSYHDGVFGPLAGLLGMDLHAVRPARAGEKPEPFADDAARSAFLTEVKGKSPEELGRMAREAVIEEMHRIYD